MPKYSCARQVRAEADENLIEDQHDVTFGADSTQALQQSV